jgi:hypothetical protein
MKIRSVKNNNRKKALEITISGRTLLFPHSKLEPRPKAGDLIRQVLVDQELSREAVTYVLESGKDGAVHIEQVLEYNQDPSYVRDALLYKLTIEAQKRVDQSALSKREIIRRLSTSATQLYRLLDQTNYRKSVDQMLLLLCVLDCVVDLAVRTRSDRHTQAA